MSARSYVLPAPAFAQQATSNATAVTLHAKRGVIRFFDPATIVLAGAGVSFTLTNNFITDANTYVAAAQAEGNGYLTARVESTGVHTAQVTLYNLNANPTVAGPLAIYFEVLN